ncbi:inositol monophosphatase family protein [Streptomyces decoyicus]|uniref:inositol monophosphatase family protein n=1 Tax=Streptomyces decoyicus TaxID=249567 RepID=UPI0033AF98F2
MTNSTDTPGECLPLLAPVVSMTVAAGERLNALFSPEARPASRAEMFAALERNDEAVLGELRNDLTELRPQAKWIEEDQKATSPASGEWWAVDAVEGNVNHVHGLPDWGVTVTLIRDQEPVLTVVRQPVGDLTYSAVRGSGAHLNGSRLHVSAKTDLQDAIVATGQAEAGQEDTYRRIGDSITAMLGKALLVRASVPSTFPMLLVAAGHHDVFWQYAPVLLGVAAGILIVTESGGRVTQIDGSPWRLGSPDILVTTPALHQASMDALAIAA